MKHDLEGVCQDCMYLEKIRPLFEQLQQENKQLKETYKEVFNNYQSLKEKSETLTSLNIYQSDKIQQLKDNWNELKEYAKDNLYFYSGYQGEDLETDIAIQGVLNKMQELERGVSDE